MRAIWERIGIHSHKGFTLHLSSLHSENSSGIGEYLDLLPMIDFAKEVGFDVIQLLPLNDSGEDPSPYSALSSIALHPINLSLQALPYVLESKNLAEQIEEMHLLCQTKRVQYHTVLEKKRLFFKDYFDEFGDKLFKDPEFYYFENNNPWLKKYALYKTLKESMTFVSWELWPQDLKTPTEDDLKNLYKLHHKAITRYSYLQFLCFLQMKQVKAYAEEQSIYIKGDIPILISPDSADVWLERTCFSLEKVVGHPPDVFNAEGQLWGFPSYRWDEIEKNDFSWWKTRLKVAENFYHMYRLDHVAGFYRLWLIPYGKKPTEGSWQPEKRADAVALGHKLLQKLISFSNMLPIAEDLGIIPKAVFDSLRSLGLAGTRVIRWMRTRGISGDFYPFEEYFPVNMTCVSTHDSETLEHWWNELPKEAQAYADFRGFEYETPLTKATRKKILKEALRTPTLLHINLLQEYLALVPSFVSKDPKEERINLPGYILDTNWTYRFIPSCETMINSQVLKNEIADII